MEVTPRVEKFLIPFLHGEAGFLFPGKGDPERRENGSIRRMFEKQEFFRLDRRDGCEERVARDDRAVHGHGPDSFRMRHVGSIRKKARHNPSRF